jgi:hypothetical protein
MGRETEAEDKLLVVTLSRIVAGLVPPRVTDEQRRRRPDPSAPNRFNVCLDL